ncbi:MAG: hypothetical protein JSW68_07395, partial [Burkholderiales bacterium]
MVAIYGMAAGGLLALGVMLHQKRGPVARANLKLFLTGAMARQGIATVARDLGEHTAARIPYGVAIAAGYAIFLAEGVLA